MNRKKLNDLEWLEFDLLANTGKVWHAVFLRSGGFSGGQFASLNVCLEVGDVPENVNANLKCIQEHLKATIPAWNRLVGSNNVHGKALGLVDHKSPNLLPNCDGLLTQTPGISIITQHADCQVALFYDPINHAAATVHAGWRGSAVNIYAHAIAQMQHYFHSHPADLLVCISPSLGPLKAEFINYRTELPQIFWPFQVRPNYFDFWAISEWQLKEAGIQPEHIEVARISTYENSADFFSYRRDRVTGRNATCITLK